MSFLEDVGRSLLGTSRVDQNQQMLDLEKEKLAINKQIVAGETKDSTTAIIIVSVIVLVVIIVLVWLFFFRKSS